VWALATLGHVDAAFMGELVQVGTTKLHRFNPQALANTAWALAALDEQNAACVGALVEHTSASVRHNPTDLRQLFQFMLWLDTWQTVVATTVPPLLTASRRG
jgi:hypothetical protein